MVLKVFPISVHWAQSIPYTLNPVYIIWAHGPLGEVGAWLRYLKGPPCVGVL